MKTQYRNFIIISIFVFFFSQFAQSQIMPMKDKFYIGYHNFSYNPWNWNTLFPRFSELNMNFMQNYGYHFDRQNYGNGGIDGGFFDDITLYKDNVNGLLSNWNTTFPNNNALFLEREKILRPAYGQLSDYQAENVPSGTHPRYGYVNRVGTDYSETWNGESVSGIYTGMPDVNNPGHWLISGLYENMEQINQPAPLDVIGTNASWPQKYYYSDIKTPGYKWFVLPRMRIDSADAFGPSKPVCRIVVVPYVGVSDTLSDTRTLKIDLFSSDFRDGNGFYDGKYIDLFYRNAHLLDLFVFGDSLNYGNGPISADDSRSYDPYASQVDYRIYWYGQVNVHLDRVRVCDEWAFYLFHPEIDSLQQTPYFFQAKIQQECQDASIGGNGNFGYFYMDEHMYNSFPCMASVDSLIKSYKSNSGLVEEINTQLIGLYSGIRDTLLPDEVFDQLVSRKVGHGSDVLRSSRVHTKKGELCSPF